MSTRVFPVFIPHAGCPFSCRFCNQKIASGVSASPSLEDVAAHLDSILPGAGEGEIAYFGGSFTLLPFPQQREFLALAERFVQMGRVTGIRVSTRPDGLAEDQVRLLRDYPVHTVEVGCQSFSDRVLAATGRGYRAEIIPPAVRRLRQAGFQVGLQLMPGLPGADIREARQSLVQALALQPSFLRLYPTLVLDGTELAGAWRQGQYRPLDLEEAVALCARLLVRCRLAGIPVIRLGLQGESAWLEDDRELIAGPFHPAFGQLVHSRIWRLILENLLLVEANRLVIVPLRWLSDALGHGRKNLVELREKFGDLTIQGSRHLADDRLQVGGREFSMSEQLRRIDAEDLYAEAQ